MKNKNKKEKRQKKGSYFIIKYIILVKFCSLLSQFFKRFQYYYYYHGRCSCLLFTYLLLVL